MKLTQYKRRDRQVRALRRRIAEERRHSHALDAHEFAGVSTEAIQLKIDKARSDIANLRAKGIHDHGVTGVIL